MRFPYMMRRIKRQPLAAALLFALNFVAALLLCILNSSSERLVRQIDEVYENAVITCQVSNLTGTQTEDMSLPQWVVHLFMGSAGIPGTEHINFSNGEKTAAFRSYLSVVYAKTAMRATHLGSSVTLVGLSDLQAERALQPKFDGEVQWFSGYDASIFSGAEDCCLVPASLLREQPELEEIRLLVRANDQEAERTLQIAGTYIGSSSSYYCPWNVAAQLELAVDHTVHADAITAVLRDSRTADEFRNGAAAEFFVPPNTTGERTPWEGTSMYSYYPYALLVNDDILRETVSGLEGNVLIFRLCTAAIVVLSLLLGLVVGHLIVRQRVKALALSRVLGQSNRYIFAETWMELAIATTLGIAAGVGASFLFAGCAFPWQPLLASLVFYLIGFASAIIAILRTDLIRSIKEDD